MWKCWIYWCIFWRAHSLLFLTWKLPDWLIFCIWYTCKSQLTTQSITLTRLHIKGTTVNLYVQPLCCSIAEIFKHTVDSHCDIVWHRLGKCHPAVHHNTSLPEVKDLQLLESRQIGLEVWEQLEKHTVEYTLSDITEITHQSPRSEIKDRFRF